jgi:hypothetical protein
VLLSRHRLQRLRPAWPTPRVSAPTARLVAEPSKAAPDSTPAAKATAKSSTSACAAKVSTAASAAMPTAAAVPLPTGRGCPVHQHVLGLLLRWVLRKVHVLLGPKY